MWICYFDEMITSKIGDCKNSVVFSINIRGKRSFSLISSILMIEKTNLKTILRDIDIFNNKFIDLNKIVQYLSDESPIVRHPKSWKPQ